MGAAACANTQPNGAVRTGTKMGTGSDLDAAVLAACNIGASGLVQRLQLAFSCEELINMDTFSKSDPFCILFRQTGNMWQKIGQTEVINDNLNPQWVTKITVDFHFEQQERFKVQVFDCDDDKNLQNLAAHDFIGELEFTLHEIVTTINQQMTKPLHNVKHARPGRIKIHAEEMAA